MGAAVAHSSLLFLTSRGLELPGMQSPLEIGSGCRAGWQWSCWEGPKRVLPGNYVSLDAQPPPLPHFSRLGFPLPIDQLPAFFRYNLSRRRHTREVSGLCPPRSSQDSGQSWVSSSITSPLRHFGDRVSHLNLELNSLARLVVQSSRTDVCFHSAGITGMSGSSTVFLRCCRSEFKILICAASTFCLSHPLQSPPYFPLLVL